MDTRNDDRFESNNQPKGNESRPASPTSTTADNASVYKQPSVEDATKNGSAQKMDDDSTEDRKHTP